METVSYINTPGGRDRILAMTHSRHKERNFMKVNYFTIHFDFLSQLFQHNKIGNEIRNEIGNEIRENLDFNTRTKICRILNIFHGVCRIVFHNTI